MKAEKIFFSMLHIIEGIKKMALSPKEIKVLTLVALGYSDKEIGITLKIAYATVRTHIDKAVLKLNANNRTHAVMIYKFMNRHWLEEFYEEDNHTLDGRNLFSK